MELKKKFWETWRKEYTIKTALLESLILIVVEKIMEAEFKCSPKKTLRVCYGVLYFVIPAGILFLLSMAFQPKCPCAKKRCNSCSDFFESCAKIFLPSLIWIVILLMDGKYMACLCKTDEEIITGDNTKQPSDCYIHSQISGLVLILGIVVSFAIYKFSRWHSNCGESIETQDQLEMGDTSTTKQN